MRRARGAAPALLLTLLMAPAVALAAGGGTKTGAQAGSKDGAAGGKKSAAQAAPPEAKLAFTVNGSPITVADLWAFLQSKMTMLHAYRIGRASETFQELAAKRVDQELLAQEALRMGLDAEVERGIFRFRRNQITGTDYLLTAVAPTIVASPEELAAQLPHDFRTFKIRQVLLETGEEAENVRRQLAAGADFVALVREKSVGWEARKDGLLWDYKADGGIFNRETEKYIFALPLNEVSKVIPLQIGFAVVRVEEKKDPRPGYVERVRERTRAKIAKDLLKKRAEEIVAAGGERFTLDSDALGRLTAEWREKGVAGDREVGRAAGNSVLFSELVAWQKDQLALSPDLNHAQLLAKLEAAVKAVLDESVLAAEARRQGHKLSKAAQVGVDFHKRAALLAELHRREIARGVVVKDEELRPYWEARRDAFQEPEALELRHILVQDPDEAARLLVELRGGADFEQLAREHSTDPATKDKGGALGFIQRGQTVQAFEDLAFALVKPGEIAREPVRTQYGVHLVQLVSRRPMRQYSYEESKERLREMLRRDKESALEAEVVNRLRASAKIVAYEKNLTLAREAFVKKMETPPPKAMKGHH